MTEPATEFATAFWGDAMADEEPLREARFPLVEFQTEIARRVIRRWLPGRPQVLDVGAGTGRYSLPIAAAGHRVTHVDVSPAMLQRAMAAAARQGLTGIEFREGDVRDLRPLGDGAFDLTLCLDAPISYAYPEQARAVAEVCRVTREVLVLMVSSRSGVVPFMIDFDLSGEFVPPEHRDGHDPFFLTESVWRHGVERFPPEFTAHLARNGKLTPPDYAFTVPEITTLLEENGFAVAELGGPGALARSVRPESLAQIRADQALYERFIGYSLAFDFDPHNLGLGAVNLLIVARRTAAAASRPGRARGRRRKR